MPREIIRPDGLCGTQNPLSDGNPTPCDPNGSAYCCSKWGHCGNTKNHCECAECVDYRNFDSSGILLL